MRRLLLSLVTALSMLATIVAVPTVAHADDKTIQVSCNYKTNSLFAPGVNSAGDPFPAQIHTEAPATVQQDEEFTIKLTVDPVNVSLKAATDQGVTLKKTARIKLDMAIPDGFTFINGSVDESHSNLKNGKIIQVNENGMKDENGTILRLADSSNTTIDKPDNPTFKPGGLSYEIPPGSSSLNLNFPVITLTLKANRNTSLGDYYFGVRTAGKASTPNNGENFLTLVVEAHHKVAGDLMAAVWCVPTKKTAASQLVKVEVTKYIPPAATTVSVDPVTAFIGTPTKFKAHVTATLSGENQNPGIPDGQIHFFTEDGLINKFANLDETGFAQFTQTFDRSRSVNLKATYIPAKKKLFEANTATISFEIKKRDPRLAFATLPTEVFAGTRLNAAATVASGAEGTVTFAIDTNQGIGQVDPNNHTASAGITVPALSGAETEQKELVATFNPKAGSFFEIQEIRQPITVKPLTETSITITGKTNTYTGRPVDLIAQITAPNGQSAHGTVVFTADGFDYPAVKITDENQTARLSFTPDNAGDFVVKAVFTSTDETIKGAEAKTKVHADPLVAKDINLTATPPDTLAPGAEGTLNIRVEPATTGSITAIIDGHEVTKEINGGVANLPVQFDRTGSITVPVTFTPDDPELAHSAHTAAIITVAIPKIVNATVVLDTPRIADEDEKPEVDATVTVPGIKSDFVSGYLFITIDGEKLPDPVPVVHGVAKFNTQWRGYGSHTMSAQFSTTEDEKGIVGEPSKLARAYVPAPPDYVPPTTDSQANKPQEKTFLQLLIPFLLTLFGPILLFFGIKVPGITKENSGSSALSSELIP